MPRRFVLIAFAALAGCSDSTTGPGTPPSSVDVAALVAAASNTSYSTVARAVALLPGVAVSPINPATCPYSSADQEFVCAPVTRNGITYKAVYQLLDVNGHPLSTADATTLAAVRSITDIDGTTSFVFPTTGDVSATTIHSHADNTLSGLLTTKHVLNGSTAEHDTSSSLVGSAAASLTVAATTAVSNLDIPATAGAYPASGMITTDASSTETIGNGSSLPPLVTHAVITFNGTSVVTIVLGTGSFTERCTLDLTHASSLTCSTTSG